MDEIKNCFLHGQYEGDACLHCEIMRKERGTDKDAELATLRAEVARLRGVIDALRVFRQAEKEYSAADDSCTLDLTAQTDACDRAWKDMYAKLDALDAKEAT